MDWSAAQKTAKENGAQQSQREEKNEDFNFQKVNLIVGSVFAWLFTTPFNEILLFTFNSIMRAHNNNKQIIYKIIK